MERPRSTVKGLRGITGADFGETEIRLTLYILIHKVIFRQLFGKVG